MYVSVTTIPIPDEAMVPRMEASFAKNMPNLREIDGFVSFELWKQKGQVKSITHWQSKEAFERYANSETFKKHHNGGGHRQAKVEYYEAATFNEQ